MWVIPSPLQADQGDLHVELQDSVTVLYSGEGASQVAHVLAEHLQRRLDIDAEAEALDEGTSDLSDRTVFKLTVEDELAGLEGLRHGQEGYEVKVSGDMVSVRAVSAHGLFNGMQTVLQLLPATRSASSSSILLQDIQVKFYMWLCHFGLSIVYKGAIRGSAFFGFQVLNFTL